jgi:urease accessory protein
LPLQALAATDLADGTAGLMLLNPSGGLVGGDLLLTQIAQEEGTRLCLTTPSATRVYRTLDRPAVQETHISVGDHASLEYLPDHVIPHRHSRLRQTLRVQMSQGSRAILWDAIAAGRLAHGECWDFDEIDSRKEILLRGRPVFLNRTLIRPGEGGTRRLVLPQGFGYLATLVIVADGCDRWKEVVEALRSELETLPRIYGGASLLSMQGCVVKLLSPSAADLARAQGKLWACARKLVVGSLPVDLRKY